MGTISVTDLRANLMKTIENIRKVKTIIVTSHGRPVAMITSPPDERKEAQEKLKAVRKTPKIGDLVTIGIKQAFHN